MDEAGRVLVVGAGIGGLTAAVELARRGLPVTVIEKAERVGGKMREVVVSGRAVDALSPHDRAWVDANALVRASQDSLSAAAAIPLLRPAEGLEVLEAMLREARASDDEARAVYRQAIAAWKAGKPAAGGRAATPPAAAGS